jgi:ankyrin repeat protein
MIQHGRWQATALDLASFNGRVDCVRVLLNHGANADVDVALMSAVAQNHLEVAHLLLAAGADTETALVRARELGHEEIVELLAG